MYKIRRPFSSLAGVVAFWITLWPVPLPAQMTAPGQTTPSHAPPNTPITKQIAGTVARVDGTELLLRVRGGTTETYQLSPAVRLRLVRKGTLADLATGRSIQCVSIYSHGAEMLAGECQLYPAGTQPAGATAGGSDPTSTPTISGTITDLNDETNTAKGAGRILLVRISTLNAATTMTVSPLTKILLVSPGDASALKRGARVRGITEQAADGTGVIQDLEIAIGARANGA